ncbi:MAG: 50S ribosomal protein L29 [Elusimicrobia bacterium]|nr:50S ribosomal protein L29 [Elusimicrobiota bacterium]
MKRKEKESLKNSSKEELAAQMKDAHNKLFQLKFKRISAPLSNPVEMRILRRKIARIKTWLKEKNLAEVEK